MVGLQSILFGLIFFLGAIALSNQLFTDQSIPLLVRDLNCNGTESFALDCAYNQRRDTSCGMFEEAGIVCQGEL